jgi:uncharacterized membrane-anchored protein YhcB (DUF1043 family)
MSMTEKRFDWEEAIAILILGIVIGLLIGRAVFEDNTLPYKDCAYNEIIKVNYVICRDN